jgi:hypothetical protein
MGMKKSTIEMVIRNKVDDLLKTIENPDLVNLMKQNIIVSGGCITSMLLGEKVNDYDIYFRNYETALAATEYYVGKYKSNMESEIVKKHIHVEKAVITNIKGIDEDRIKIIVKSLGAVGETEQAPLTEFEEVDALEEAEELVSVVRDKKDKYRPVFLTDNAITLKDRVQIVIRFFGEPNEIHENYDFAHCKCYYDYNARNLVLPQDALEAMLSKTLIYQGSLYPLASIFRTRKFIARGWRITAGQMLKMIWQAHDIDLHDPAVLKEQLIGVDSVFMGTLLHELDKNKSDRIDQLYLAKLIDTIFE